MPEVIRKRRAFIPQANMILACGDKTWINFSCNDYLGLSQHTQTKQAAIDAINQYGVGSGASQLVSGYSHLHQQLEQAIAAFTKRDAAIVFNTGYQANLGVMTSLFSTNDMLYQDKLNHASLYDGAKLSGVKQQRYKHSDVNHLQQLLNKADQEKIWLVSEGIYSVFGDIAPLPELIACAQQYNVTVIVDDTHGFGVLGQQGAGTLAHYNIDQQQVPLVIGTFGKAFGGAGAFVAGDANYIEQIMQQARSLIYTTAFPAAIAASNTVALQLCQQGQCHQQLLDNINYFKQCANELQLPIAQSISAIQTIKIANIEQAQIIHQQLMDEGIYLSLMRPPTVPPNNSCLRISITAAHSKQQIDYLLEKLHCKIKYISNK